MKENREKRAGGGSKGTKPDKPGAGAGMSKQPLDRMT